MVTFYRTQYVMNPKLKHRLVLRSNCDSCRQNLQMKSYDHTEDVWEAVGWQADASPKEAEILSSSNGKLQQQWGGAVLYGAGDIKGAGWPALLQ